MGEKVTGGFLSFEIVTQAVREATKKGKKKDLWEFATDIDRDGVPNKKDCRPLNPRKQDVEPNQYMAQKMRYLPIYVTDKFIDDDFMEDLFSGNERIYHFMSNDAQRFAPKARKYALSILKKYPELITEIKRKAPHAILISSKPSLDNDWGYTTTIGRNRYVVVYAPTVVERYALKEEGKEYGIRKPVAGAMGTTVRHELEHVKQYREAKLGVRGRRRTEQKLFKGEYEDRPGEKEARRAESRFVKKHHMRSRGNVFPFLFSGGR